MPRTSLLHLVRDYPTLKMFLRKYSVFLIGLFGIILLCKVTQSAEDRETDVVQDKKEIGLRSGRFLGLLGLLSGK